MRLPTLIAVAVSLTAWAPDAAAQRTREVRLKEYESEAGRFRVKVPDRLKATTKDLIVGPGRQAVPVTTEQVEGPAKAVFAVTFTDYPESFREVPVKAILDGVRDGLKGADGKVTKDEEKFLGADPDKVPGRDVRVESGEKVVRAQVFLAGTRLYQVMVTGTRAGVATKAADEFLASFGIVR